MDVTEITQVVAQPPAATGAESPAPFTQCEECGTPVDHVQRYCVGCGAHRRNVPDPAARYFSAATARARGVSVVTSAPAGAPAAPKRGSGVAAAVILAVIPVALAIGVAVGRSSNNDDAKLIRELGRSQPQVATASHAAGAAPAASATTMARATRSRTSKHASRSSTKARTHARATSSTRAPSRINGSASTSQKQQGQAIVNRLQHTNGTNYMNQLPSQVVVP